MMTVAALYIDAQRGPYPAMGCDSWGVERDATNYAGPWPVVSHPPCGPWGRLRHMCGPALLAQERLGLIAFDQVRRWGGVLEHPAHSRLFDVVGAPHPGGVDRWGGFTLHVEQWWWGHRAVKPTWIYIVGTTAAPALPPVPGIPRPPSGRSAAKGGTAALRSMTERLSKFERHLTPPAFARWLVDIAATCAPPTEREPAQLTLWGSP